MGHINSSKGDIILHILPPSHRGVGRTHHRAHPSVRGREHILRVCNNNSCSINISTHNHFRCSFLITRNCIFSLIFGFWLHTKISIQPHNWLITSCDLGQGFMTLVILTSSSMKMFLMFLVFFRSWSRSLRALMKSLEGWLRPCKMNIDFYWGSWVSFSGLSNGMEKADIRTDKLKDFGREK